MQVLSADVFFLILSKMLMAQCNCERKCRFVLEIHHSEDCKEKHCCPTVYSLLFPHAGFFIDWKSTVVLYLTIELLLLSHRPYL